MVNNSLRGGDTMVKSSLKKTISKLKPKQQECCSVEIKEKKDVMQEPEAKKEQNNNSCC
jgi:mRNA-degrading endonuclease RelE of RelBE toxin-antitoxin system